MLKLLQAACIIMPSVVFSQTFSGSTGSINDVATEDFPVTVSGLPTSINETTFGLESVCIDLNHTYDADLTIVLISPDGSQIILAASAGGDGDDYTGTCFNGTSTQPIYSANAPFTGNFRSDDPVGNLNNNQDPNGNWTLHIVDCCAGDDGVLNSWSISFGNSPAAGFHFTSSNLPIVVLNTGGNDIPDDPKMDAVMGIIYNGPGQTNFLTDPFNNYNNHIGIELHGSSSLQFPQKSYAIETRDVNGTQHDTVLLGMPEEHDWLLYAPYDDKTCIRNILTYELANQTGHYAPRTKLCELVLNDHYMGMYVLIERIKRDANRVDIAKLQPTEISGDDLTGGYIIKLDRDDGNGTYWTSNYPASTGFNPEIVYVYPKANDIVPQQRDYIQAYVDSFETALATQPFLDTVNGYRHFADASSFIDYFILTEACKNVDGYRLSTFLYKDKASKGGKLVAGPAWDYNLAWWNANYCGGDDFTGWQYQQNDLCGGSANDIPFWWAKFMTDERFQEDLKCRWRELRDGIFSDSHIYSIIDSLVAEMGPAADRHFEKWPILGTYVWPNPSPIPSDFPGEITALKQWVNDRLAWLDQNLPGTCHLSLDERTLNVEVFPNPFTDELKIASPQLSGKVTVSLTELSGKKITSRDFNADNGTIELKELSGLIAGVYLLEVKSENYHTFIRVTHR